MNDHNIHTTNPDSKELTKRLERLKHESNDGTFFPRSRGPNRQSRASSFSSDNTTLSSFSKTNTMSSTGSDDNNESNHFPRHEVSRAIPVSGTNREHAEVRAGNFSKGRVGRRGGDRGRGKEKQKEMEFKYYGRHSNQWLFNDFSFTDSIRKSWGKVFTGDGKYGDGK